MANSINSKAKEYYDNDDSGGSLNSNLKDFFKQQGAEGTSVNSLWREYAKGEGGASLNSRLSSLWGSSGSIMTRWKDTLGLTWDEVKAFFNFRDTDPDFLLDGSTSFDGSNDYISIADADNLSFGDGSTDSAFTISAWVKMDDATSFTIASKGIYNSTAEWKFGLGSDDALILIIYDESVASTYEYGLYTTTLTSYEGQWVHLSGTYDGRGGTSATDGISLYVNGSPVTTSTGGAGTYVAMENLGADVHIGRENTAYANGSMANVGIWNRALSASEIESIYWRGSYSELKDTELTNLVSWYDLQGDVLDKQGSNNGTNNGATLNSDSYSGESPFKPRIQDLANPKMAVQLADGSTSFDGSNDYIDTGSTFASTFNSSFTISGWYKFDDGQPSASEMLFGGWTSGYASGLQLYQTTTGKLHGNYGANSNSTEFESNDVLFTDGQQEWHHIVYQVDSATSQMYLYVDGSAITLASGSNDGDLAGVTMGDFSNSSDNLVIGARNKYGTIDTEGAMDISNFSIHSATLTQAQIQELMFTEKYSGLSSDLKTNLVSWYDLGSTTLGSELVTNGGFDSNTTSWSAVDGSLASVSGGQSGNCLELTRTGASNQYAKQTNVTLVVGKSYEFSFYVKSGTSGDEAFSCYCYDGSTVHSVAGTSTSSWVKHTKVFVMGGSDSTLNEITLSKATATAGTMLFDSVSLKEVQVEDLQASNDGSVYGATTTTGYTSSPHGVVDPLNYGDVYSGRALSFDNTNDYVLVRSAFQDLFRGSHSISCWIKPVDGQPSDAGRFIGAKNTSGDYFYFGQFTNGKVAYVYASNGNGDGITSDFLFADGLGTEWTHAVALADSTNGNNTNKFKLYINGQLDTAVSTNDATVTFSEYTSTEEVYIGTQGYNGSPSGDYWGGKISGIKFFNTLLTEAQIRELYTKPETVLPTGVSASNLKLDLPMQEGAGSYLYDGSGNQNHGTISGATWATGESDGYQSSLVRSNTPMIFDGSDDKVTVSDAGGIQNIWDNGGSISCWVYPNSDGESDGGRIFEKVQYVLQVHSESAGKVDLQFYIKFTGTDGTWDTSSTEVSINEWSHIVVTYNADSVSNNPIIYVNGSSVTLTESTTPTSAREDDSGDDLYIGNNSGGTRTFDGLINDFSVWDVALDADAVTALYNSGTPLLPTSDSGNYDNSDDLQGYWRNDGITTWTDRANTGIASFDGSGDYLSLGTAYSYTNNTFSAWIKPEANSSADRRIIDTTDGNDDGLLLYVRGDSDKIQYSVNGSGLQSASTYNGQWVHIVGTYDGSTQKLYINGSLDQSTSTSQTISTTTNAIIGARSYTSQIDSFKGLMGNVNIFNTALTASEVSELYAIDKRSSISGHSKFSNCVGSWLMGADSSDTTSTIQDQTSNNNDATVSGASLVGYNDGTATNATTSIVIPEGSTSGRDSQGFLLTDTTSTSNNGLRMYGGGEVIKLDDSELFHLGTKDFTFEFWAKFNETSTTRGFFNYFKDANNRFHLSNYSSIDFWSNVGGSDSSTQISNTRDLNWHHYVITKESSTMKIYIDSSVVKTNTSWTQNINYTGGTFYIGVRTDDGSNLTDYNVDGSIDEFRIYHKALSANEVTKNYNNSLSKHS